MRLINWCELSNIHIVFFIALYYMSSNCADSPSSFILGMTGDVMLGRLVNEKIQQTHTKYVWGDLLPLLHSTNINLINLETTLTRSTKRVPKVFNFKSDPKHVSVLKEASIDIVSLANNHIKDFNNQGLEETINVLNNADILHIGAGSNIDEARKPVITHKKGIKIGFIGATDNEPEWRATAQNPGVNYFTVDDTQQLESDIRRLKVQVDIVIVSVHWGPNMRERPTKPYIDAAHRFIEAGADIIHGHSAHIFQGIEIYNKSLILYDTGDFIDDYRIDQVLRNDQSFFFKVFLNKKGVEKLELIPVIINNMQVNNASNKEAATILEKMRTLSRAFGTTIDSAGFIRVQ